MFINRSDFELDIFSIQRFREKNFNWPFKLEFYSLLSTHLSYKQIDHLLTNSAFDAWFLCALEHYTFQFTANYWNSNGSLSYLQVFPFFFFKEILQSFLWTKWNKKRKIIVGTMRCKQRVVERYENRSKWRANGRKQSWLGMYQPVVCVFACECFLLTRIVGK